MSSKLETMQNFIFINKTFTEITPESSEQGDFSDHGFIEQDLKVTFRELVDLMKDHKEKSSSGEITVNTWLSSGYYISDYSKGVEREECIHFSNKNAPNVAKYWAMAYKFANR